VVNDIRRAAGDGQCTVLLALDISAVFDAVDHTTLVEHARTVFSINGATLDWLRSFVTERSQFIAIGTERSSEDFNYLSAMEICAVDVSRWFVENALLLNPDKTEAVVFGTRKRLTQLHLSSGIDVSGTCIDFTESIKLLGVVLDASLTFEKRAGCRTWMPFSHQSTTAHQTTSDIGRCKDLRCSHGQ